jgi:hypothetical protein
MQKARNQYKRCYLVNTNTGNDDFGSFDPIPRSKVAAGIFQSTHGAVLTGYLRYYTDELVGDTPEELSRHFKRVLDMKDGLVDKKKADYIVIDQAAEMSYDDVKKSMEMIGSGEIDMKRVELATDILMGRKNGEDTTSFEGMLK